MKKTPGQILFLFVLSAVMGALAGCASTVSAPPAAPSIASFAASQPSILAGGSTTLIGAFANGAGVITPGNLAVTSGSAVTVNPADTTTYTLTVTNSAGATVAQTATVTVNLAGPAISSFTASPSSIVQGGSALLAAEFSGGTGVITPGNIAVSSGGSISVSPSATQAYTLTVSQLSGIAVTKVVTVTVTPAAPLAVPTGLTASPGNQSVTLSWDAVAGATSYLVSRSTASGGPYAQIGTTTSTGFQDETVANHTAYFYVVQAVNALVTSADSNVASTTPMAPPQTPVGLVATAGPGDGAVALAWQKAADATSYQIGRSANAGGPYATAGTVNAPAITWSDVGLQDGVAYYYVVQAVNPVATSSASDPATATPIAALIGLTAVASDRQVALFWNASLGASSYDVLGSTTSSGPTTVAGTSSMNRFQVAGLTDGDTYYYRVVAKNATGASAPSEQVSATPSASSTVLPPPDDPTRRYVGLNTWYLNDWDGSAAFVDVMKQARYWMDSAWAHAATTDAQGWPTEDASTVLITGTPQTVNGVYKLAFNGKATLSLMWVGGSITNQAYDGTTNTTTADVDFEMTSTSAPSIGLVFTNTQRTATSGTGTGFTNARLYRPGYPTDGSVVFTTPFLNALGKVGTVRMMEWNNMYTDFVVNWADRTSPQSATQGGLPLPPYTGPSGTVYNGISGVALEYQVMLCNTLMVDCYINIPVAANDDFVRNMALVIAFGSDGLNPYTSPQAHPVFAPLNPSLHVYLEYANEVWNSGDYVSAVVQEICENLPSNHPLLTVAPNVPYNFWYTVWRYEAWRMATVSQIFESIFGQSEMMTRVRPLLETQEGNGQATLSESLQWLDAYTTIYLSPVTSVSNLIYGGGGSAYYGVINTTSAAPDSVFATGNYPDPSVIAQWATDSMWDYNYGIRHMAYEGGPGMPFTDAASTVLNADPRMTTMVETYQQAWDSQGGDHLVYYNLVGPPAWEFTPSISTTNTPKFAALANIQATPKSAVTLGAALPGTLNAAAESSGSILSDGWYPYAYSIGGQGCIALAFTGAGEYAAYPAHAATAFSGTLTLNGGANNGAQVSVWINGVQQGTVTMQSDPSQAMESSTSIPVQIPAGLSAIRLQSVSGSVIFCNLTVQ